MTTEKKIYSIELFNKFEKNMLQSYLIRNEIQTRISAYYNGWHYEVLLNDEELEDINAYLGALRDFKERF